MAPVSYTHLCGHDFPVSLRYSVVSKTKGLRQGALPGEDYVEAVSYTHLS